MPFEFRPALRDRVSLLIGLAGASGSGKTRSALEIARGLVGGADHDERIAFIDSEAGRAKHYAPPKGQRPGRTSFGFQHGELRPPFTPEAYMEAIAAADQAGFEVIVIDSFSHEYDGEGGLTDTHAAAVEKAVEAARKAHSGNWPFDPDKAAERASVGAWKDPKRRHKRLVSRLLQCRAHLIVCMRADEKIRIEKVKDERGRERTVIVQPKDMPAKERWAPICEKRFPYELTCSFVLTPMEPGYPVPIKLQDQHRAFFPENQPISEESGRLLAEWARGSGDARPGSTSVGEASPSPQAPADVDQSSVDADQTPLVLSRAAAMRGTAAYESFWRKLGREDRQELIDAGAHASNKAAAAQADQHEEVKQ